MSTALSFAGLLLLWYLGMSIACFIAMGIDKLRARAGEWRIPEKRLFLLAALGGAAGGILGMLAFRHKTKHRSFVIGMPALLLFNVLCGCGLVYFSMC